MHQALITGASQGFGRALLGALVARGWACVVDARDTTALNAATAELPNVRAVPGDVADSVHRATLMAAAGERLDLLVHNARTLGPSPLLSLAAYPLDALRHVYEVDVIAPVVRRGVGGVVCPCRGDHWPGPEVPRPAGSSVGSRQDRRACAWQANDCLAVHGRR